MGAFLQPAPVGGGALGSGGVSGAGPRPEGVSPSFSPPAAATSQDIEFFDAKKTGQLVSRLTTDVQEFKSSFKLVISQVSVPGGGDLA